MVEAESDDTAEGWREVHSTLLSAVQTAKTKIAILKAQRRYLLEEIAWNLDDSGQRASHSSWKQPILGISTDKTETTQKRKSVGQAVKRKKPLTEKPGSSTGSQKEPKKRKKSEIDAPRKKATNIILKLSKHHAETPVANDGLDSGGDHSESEPEQEMATLPHGGGHIFTGDEDREQTPPHDEMDDSTTHASVDPGAINLGSALSPSTYMPPSSFLASAAGTMVYEDRPTLSLLSTPHQPPPIRNYTSLQDIAMNDESDEDRF